MKFTAFWTTLSFVGGLVTVAQDVPKADLFLGYSFLRANSARNIPAFTNNGGVGTLGLNFNKNVAFEFEFGGYHNGNIHNIQFDTTEMTYLFGPRFSVSRSRTIIPYIHTLFGGIHLTTSLPVTVAPTPTDVTPTTTRLKASQDNFAMALGGPHRYDGRSLSDAHARTRKRGANDEVFDHFLTVFMRVLIDLRVPHGKIHQWLAVFEGARGQILNR